MTCCVCFACYCYRLDYWKDMFFLSAAEFKQREYKRLFWPLFVTSDHAVLALFGSSVLGISDFPFSAGMQQWDHHRNHSGDCYGDHDNDHDYDYDNNDDVHRDHCRRALSSTNAALMSMRVLMSVRVLIRLQSCQMWKSNRWQIFSRKYGTARLVHTFSICTSKPCSKQWINSMVVWHLSINHPFKLFLERSVQRTCTTTLRTLHQPTLWASKDEERRWVESPLQVWLWWLGECAERQMPKELKVLLFLPSWKCISSFHWIWAVYASVYSFFFQQCNNGIGG